MKSQKTKPDSPTGFGFRKKIVEIKFLPQEKKEKRFSFEDNRRDKIVLRS